MTGTIGRGVGGWAKFWMQGVATGRRSGGDEKFRNWKAEILVD
jgi:hypothetical protein